MFSKLDLKKEGKFFIKFIKRKEKILREFGIMKLVLILFVLNMIKNVFSLSYFKIYKDLSLNNSSNSLNLTKTISFGKQIRDKIHCIAFCQRELNCDLVKIESFVCEMYKFSGSVSFVNSQGTQVFVKMNKNLKLMTYKIMG